jgi:hypothetical protein
MNKVYPPRRFWLIPVGLAMVCLCAAPPAKAELVYVTLQTSVASFDISSGNGATIAATKTTVASGLTEAMGLVFGGDGNLYVNNYSTTAGSGTVSKIVPGSGTATSFATGLTNNRGITYSGSAGEFSVTTDGNPGSISEISSSGTVSPLLTFGSNTSPYGIALDASGNLYTANNANYSISKIVNGVPSTFATFTPGQGVRAVAVAPNGDVYSAGDFGVNVTTQGGTTTNLASGLSFAFGLAFDSGGNILVADYVSQSIASYDSSGTQLYSFSTGAGSSNRPRYVAFDRAGSGFNQVVPEPGSVATGVAALIVAGGYAARRRVRRMSRGSARTAGR